MTYSTKQPVRDTYLVFGSPHVTEREVDAVREVVDSRWLGTGPKVAEFEDTFAAFCGSRYAVACNSCTAALHLAMIATGVGPGDEVITSDLTFCATANAIIHTGARPVFVDVEPGSMNIDPVLVEKAVTDRTRAIVPVHFAGRPAAMDRLREIAAAHELLVIEDAAHAIESVYHGEKVGSMGDATCFSFYVTKNIYTGEGGMVATDREDIADAARIYGLHGMTRDAWRRYSDEGYRHYQVVYPGFKYNMMDIQAALGLAQLPRAMEYHARRCEIWARYDSAFADLPLERPSPEEPGTVHARHLYTVQVDKDRAGCDRDTFMDALHAENIGSGVHYRALHKHDYYRRAFGLDDSMFPRADRLSDTTLSLPLSPALSDKDVDSVIEAVCRICRFYG